MANLPQLLQDTEPSSHTQKSGSQLREGSGTGAACQTRAQWSGGTRDLWGTELGRKEPALCWNCNEGDRALQRVSPRGSPELSVLAVEPLWSEEILGRSLVHENGKCQAASWLGWYH